jgi:hypothetical protein
MAHVIERAASGRAKCRGCGARIAATEFRFGERLPNPFADEGSEMTHWFHLTCGAFRRPEAFLETLGVSAEPVDERERLEREARLGVAHRRLPRLTTAERAPTGRATCRSCREPIEKDGWRISLVYYEDGRFMPSGFIHARCVQPYVETSDVLDRVKHFSPELSVEDLADLAAAVKGS